MSKIKFEGRIFVDEILPYFKTLANFVDETLLVIDQEGLKVEQCDKAMVCYINFRIDRERFNEFKFERKKPLKVGIKVGEFVNILKKVRNYVKITLTDKFIVSFDNSIFKLPIIEVDSELPDMSKLEYKQSYDISFSDLRRALENAKLIGSETITIETNGKLVMKGESDFAESITEIKGVLTTEKVRVKYPLEYLIKVKIPQSAGVEEIVKLSFKKDYPLKLEWQNLKFVLAPRIEEI